MICLIGFLIFLTLNNVLYDCLTTSQTISNDTVFKGVEKVKIEEYYQSQCTHCQKQYTEQLAPVVQKLNDHIELHTYPYGNAKIITENGTITFECQHGPTECYGNGLHACAIYYLPEKSFYVPFNACLMRGNSTDDAVDECSENNQVISGLIKACAKGNHVIKLLKNYATETEKLVDRTRTPYTVVNGKVLDSDDNLLEKVCEAFKNPPKECTEN